MAIFLKLPLLALLIIVQTSNGQPFADLECEVKKAALAYGARRITNNVAALERGLNFAANCSHGVHEAGAVAEIARVADDALQLYVATTGDDRNPGTADKPFESLAQARDAIRFHRRQLDNASLWTGAVVHVAEGKYFLRHSLHLSHEDSGTPDGPIAYVADDPTGKVILSGGTPLTLQWQKTTSSPSIYQATVPEGLTFTTLFVNGVRQIRARFPNGDPQQMTGVCYYTSQEEDEGCTAYASATGGIKEDERLQDLFSEQPDGERTGAQTPLSPAAHSSDARTVLIEVAQPVRPHHVTGDDHWPSFHYQTGDGLPEVPGFGPVYSFWNNPYTDRPTGMKYNSAELNRTWQHAETGIVHMFHTQYWGNWMFKLASQDVEKHELRFQYGGWQEARGAAMGNNHFYVENILEELDSPGEWFLDTTTSTLYFYPNATQCPDLEKAEVVAPQHQSLVHFQGSSSHPVSNIELRGFTLTETRTTFMDYYEVPSGGDWSIHRSAAVFLEGAERCAVTNCTFSAVGGNAVFLSEYVRNCTVSHNEMTLSGDSAVAAVGRTGMIDGMQPSYPARNLIANNHIHDFGMYGKQVSCYFQALACGNTFQDNVCYNGPRAGINFNDGFGGDTLLAGNLVFNMVRETDDHGMFNSWDRQPYLTPSQCTDGPPSIVPQANRIARNFLINGYAGRWNIDHDDGSAYYNNTENFMVFGGVKAYLGHDKMTGPGNVIVYPGLAARSAGKRACQCDDNGEFADQYYYGNQCFTPDGVFYTLYKCDAASLAQHVFQTRGNRHYAPGARFTVSCGGKAFSFDEWQRAGQDFNSTVLELPSPQEIVAIGMSVIDQ